MELTDKQLLDFVNNFAQDEGIKIPLDEKKILKEKEKIKFIAGNWLMHQRQAQYQENHLIGYLEWKCRKKIKKSDLI